MRAILAIGILLAAILLFGCVGGSNNQGVNTSTGGQQGTGTSGQGGTGGTSGTGGSSSGGTGGSTGGTGGTGVAGFDAAIAQKCTVKDRTTGDTTTYYVDGVGNMRVEALVLGKPIVTIVKDKILYTQATSDMQSSPMFKDCEWLSIDSSKTDTTSAGQTDNVNTDLGTMVDTAAKYEVVCTPQIVGSSLVTPSGKICDLTEILNQATQNPCASITDLQQRADCEKAMAGANQ